MSGKKGIESILGVSPQVHCVHLMLMHGTERRLQVIGLLFISLSDIFIYFTL